ncbi:hypothetical protein CK203_049834 [Vitis vinifera]|uniref:Uncharacterized protein n=1 Tax=Vitis vinifera TaxID=29760 RepID=A0A438GVV9_VITVI|nr:hypothetical protein CK203_049834 [Vitis vinifera]
MKRLIENVVNELKKQRNVEAGGCLGHFNTQNSGSDLNLPVPLNRVDMTISSNISDHYSSMGLHFVATLECLNTLEERQKIMQTNSANRELTIHTSEKSIVEQACSNDLKTPELILSMKKMKLKETQLALNSNSYILEMMKFFVCLSCQDLVYGACIYPDKRITEATTICITSTKDFKSWWIPKANGIFQSRVLHAQVLASSKQTTSVTFIILLLGVICSAGKFHVDTLEVVDIIGDCIGRLYAYCISLQIYVLRLCLFSMVSHHCVPRGKGQHNDSILDMSNSDLCYYISTPTVVMWTYAFCKP